MPLCEHTGHACYDCNLMCQGVCACMRQQRSWLRPYHDPAPALSPTDPLLELHPKHRLTGCTLLAVVSTDRDTASATSNSTPSTATVIGLSWISLSAANGHAAANATGAPQHSCHGQISPLPGWPMSQACRMP
jgi:hypothetical protein